MFLLPPPRRCILLVLTVVGVQCRAADKWLTLRTDDVVIYSDATPKDMTEFAIGYSAFRHVLRQMLLPPHSPPPTTVLLFRGLTELDRDLPPSSRADETQVSYTASIDGDALVAISVDGDRHTALQQMYEFDTIWELERSGYALPIWLSQGAGEVLASLQVRKEDCEIGVGPDGYDTNWQNGDELPWGRFFDVSTVSPEYTGPEANGMFHAQAWALMHWVLLGSPDGPQRFRKLAEAVHEQPGLDAVESVLQVDARRLSSEISRHRGAWRRFAFDASGLRTRLHIVPAAPADVRVQLANLLFATGKFAAAEAELKEAKTLAPNAAAVKEAEAREALRDNDAYSATQLYREAIAAGSTSPRAYLVSAKQSLDDNQTGGRDREGDGSPGVEHAVTEIRKALQLDPGNSDAYLLLGRAFYVRTNVDQTELAELNPGVGPGQAGEAVRFYRALLYHRLAQEDQFRNDLQHIIADSSIDDSLRQTARNQLLQAVVVATGRQVDALIRGRRFADARDLIDKRLLDETLAGAHENLVRMRPVVDEAEAWAAVGDAYRGQRWSDARSLATEFLKKYPHSRAAAGARHIRVQADQVSAAAPPPKGT